MAKDIPNTINVALDDEKTSVVSFQINEHILNEHPERIWEKYIQNFDQIAQEDRLREEREKEASAERHSVAQEVQRAVERQRRPERVVNARPRTKTDQSTLRTAFNTYELVQRSIGSGGAGKAGCLCASQLDDGQVQGKVGLSCSLSPEPDNSFDG